MARLEHDQNESLPREELQQKEALLDEIRKTAFKGPSEKLKRALFDSLRAEWRLVANTNDSPRPLKNEEFEGINGKTAQSRLSEMRAKDLEAFFEANSTSKWRVAITKHPSIRIEFRRTGFSGSDQPGKQDTLRAFWQPFLQDVSIVYTEVHFFYQQEKRFFLRFQDYNGPEEVLSTEERSASGLDGFDNSLEKLVRDVHPLLRTTKGGRHELRVLGTEGATRAAGKNAGLPLKEVRYFVTRGEMKFILRVSRCLGSLGGEPVYTMPIHEAKRAPRFRKNVILLGNLRTNYYVRTQVGVSSRHSENQLPFRAGPHAIFRGKNREWGDFDPVPNQPELVRVYGLLTRMPFVTQGESLILSSNHSAPYTAIANYLTRENSLRDLQRRLSPKAAGFPDRFQVIFSVDIDRSEQQIPGSTEMILPKIVDSHVP